MHKSLQVPLTQGFKKKKSLLLKVRENYKKNKTEEVLVLPTILPQSSLLFKDSHLCLQGY